MLPAFSVIRKDLPDQREVHLLTDDTDLHRSFSLELLYICVKIHTDVFLIRAVKI